MATKAIEHRQKAKSVPKKEVKATKLLHYGPKPVVSTAICLL